MAASSTRRWALQSAAISDMLLLPVPHLSARVRCRQRSRHGLGSPCTWNEASTRSTFRSSSSVTSGEVPEKMTPLGANASPRPGDLSPPRSLLSARRSAHVADPSRDCRFHRRARIAAWFELARSRSARLFTFLHTPMVKQLRPAQQRILLAGTPPRCGATHVDLARSDESVTGEQ